MIACQGIRQAGWLKKTWPMRDIAVHSSTWSTRSQKPVVSSPRNSPRTSHLLGVEGRDVIGSTPTNARAWSSFSHTAYFLPVSIRYSALYWLRQRVAGSRRIPAGQHAPRTAPCLTCSRLGADCQSTPVVIRICPQSVHHWLCVLRQRALVALPLGGFLELLLRRGDLLRVGEEIHHGGAQHLRRDAHAFQAQRVGGAGGLAPMMRGGADGAGDDVHLDERHRGA